MTNPGGPNNSQLGDMHPKILKNTQKEEDGKNLKMEALVKKFSFESDYLQWSRKGKSEGVNGQDHSTKNKWSGLTQNQWSDKAPAIVPTLKSYGESSGHNFQVWNTWTALWKTHASPNGIPTAHSLDRFSYETTIKLDWGT
ncbi:hypothetical protein Tco_1411743 [Tanacetum coccineum]